MRKIIMSMHTTLDGYAAGPNGEMDWIQLDNALFDLVETFTNEAGSAMYGRVTWQMMESYWPTAAQKPNATKHDINHSAWYSKVDKIVLSNSMQGPGGDKTRFIGENAVTEIQKIKAEEGKDILIFGSPSVVRFLMAHGLIDEYWLFVNPVILGKGISVFNTADKPIELKLDSVHMFDCGVTGLHYLKS
ncbi:MAG: dihydrofolate reductase family protein [Saprospiraceae bacterium]|nr:dihydrofolate reductase family protein [Lewinellaceae bacterium]